MANQASPWQRFMDNFLQSAIHSPLGAEGIARAYFKHKGYNDAQINQAIKSLDTDYSKKYAHDPVFHVRKDHPLDYVSPDNIGRGVTTLLGAVLGGVDPTYALAPGRSAVGRMAGQAAVQAPASVVRQQVEVNTGQRKKISAKKVAEDAASAAVFQGMMEGAKGLANLPKVIRGEDVVPAEAPLAQDGMPGNGSVRPMQPEEIASIMNDPEAAGGAAPMRRQNSRDREIPSAIKQEDVVPTAANDEIVEAPKAEDLNLVQDEQPPVEAQADANEALAPQEPALSPNGLFRETKRDPDGTIYLEYQPSVSKTPIPVKMGIDNGTAEIAVDQFGNGKNKLGPAEIRSAMNELADMYPEIKRFGGYRKSGAGAGRVQEIELPQHLSEADVVPLPVADPVVDTVPVDNTGYEAHTPNIEPPVPANDLNRIDAAKNFVKNIMTDESGVMRFADEDPANPKYPEAFYKLAQALREAVPARNKQEGIYHAELQKKVADMAKAREASSGIEGFHAEKGTLKGKLPTVQDYEGMSGLSQEDLNSLFDHIKNHPSLGWLQSINARDGLAKILQGEVPTRSEITLLARTMPPELIRELMKNRSIWQKIAEGTISALNTPKALMASYDVSAPLRQGVLMIGRKEFYTALGPMFKAFASPKYAKAVRENIYEDALYPVMQDSGLAIPKYDETGPMELGEHEEPFMTEFASKIPLIKIGVKASERAFNTFVYKLRADTFKTIYNTAREGGKSWDKQSVKSLSKFINTFTGRGDLGKFNNMAPALNTLLFSPKLLKSRIDSLNPKFYSDLDPTVRREAFKSVASFVTIAATVMGLAKLAGAEVGSDPRQADGWKIKVGNTRYDILGGEQQLVRLLGNVATYSYLKGKEIAKTGEIRTGFKDKTAMDNIGQFLRNKESPDVSLAHDFFAGDTAVHEDFSPKEAVIDRVTPMSAGDAEDVYADLIKHGVPQDKALAQAIVMASPSLIGASVSTYEHTKKNTKHSNGFKSSLKGGFKHNGLKGGF